MVYKKVIGCFMIMALLCTALVTVASHQNKNKESGLQAQEWVFDDNTPDPTNPQNYSLNTSSSSLSQLCEQNEDICGIIAPVDPSSSPSDPKPLIDAELADRIEREDIEHDDVFLLPMSS